MPVATTFNLNGGTLNTGGFNQTVANITLSDNGSLNFSNSNTNTFTANVVDSFTTGKILTINNWDGTYASPGSTGNYGKLLINGTALTSAILSQIKFYNAADLTTHSTLQLGTKEIVAGN